MRRKAFTMLEMLVVVGIIVLLAAILLPTLSRAMRDAQRARQAADLHAIETALEAYKSDFGDYPRFDPQGKNLATDGQPQPGYALLCWALIAPGPDTQDGAGDPSGPTDNTKLGLGFRIRGNQGKVYSYLHPDQFKVGKPHGETVFDDTKDFIADRWGNPILYYPTSKAANVHTPKGYVGDASYPIPAGQQPPLFNGHDNWNSSLQYWDQTSMQPRPTPEPKYLALMLGHQFGQPLPTGHQPINLNYLLWSAGPNGIFGPASPREEQPGYAQNWDDVTNIAQ